MSTGVDAARFLFVSGTDGDTRRYRCFHQQEQLAIQGVGTEFRESDDPQLLIDVLEYDAFILHRVPYTGLIGAVIDLARLRGKPIIFETDDLVFAPELHDEIGFVDTLSPDEAYRFRRDLHLQAETFRRCDCVLTTTDFLARQARDRGKPAYVNRNAPSVDMIEISEEAYAGRRQRLEGRGGESHPLVVGYFSGTGSHDRDFRVITEPLIWMLDTYPDTVLHISGHLSLGPAFSGYEERIRRASYVDWRELPHLIARADLNLAPLEEHNPFCRAKSENKFVEAALVGVPTIASPTEAFEFAISDGKDGFLPSTPREWKGGLRALLESATRRWEMGEAARRKAYARYLPEERASELFDTVKHIIGRYSGPSASPEEILQEWARRMKHYAEGVRKDILRWEAEVESLRLVLNDYENQLSETVKLKNASIEHQEEIIQHCRAVIDRKDQIIEQREQTIKQREQTIEDIMQGRVMRLLTSCQHWWSRLKGEEVS
jgi:glycosyltransferase involved in cell wall biosynthesis